MNGKYIDCVRRLPDIYPQMLEEDDGITISAMVCGTFSSQVSHF